MTRDFHMGEILCLATDYYLREGTIDEFKQLLGHMTGDAPATHQLPRMMAECKPHLLRQHPQLAGPEMDAAVADLERRIKAIDNVPPNPDAKAEGFRVSGEWLAEQITRLGAERLPVEPIELGDYIGRNPVHEAIEMAGADKVMMTRKD